MATSNTYFLIPIDKVQNNPGYRIWFVSWSGDTGFHLSSARPDPNAILPWAIGATPGAIPTEAIKNLDTGGKDIPPPGLDLQSTSSSQEAFAAAFQRWLTARNAVEKPST